MTSSSDLSFFTGRNHEWPGARPSFVHQEAGRSSVILERPSTVDRGPLFNADSRAAFLADGSAAGLDGHRWNSADPADGDNLLVPADILEQDDGLPVAIRPRLMFLEEQPFKSFIGIVLCFNIFCVWMETDSPKWEGLWNSLESLFLLIYIVELCLMLVHHGPQRFFNRGIAGTCQASLDCFVIVLGVTELWIVPMFIMGDAAIEPPIPRGPDEVIASQKIRHTARWLFWLEMLRLLRVFRLVRMWPPLLKLVNLLMHVIANFMWILVLMFCIMYVVAVIMTTMLRVDESELHGPWIKIHRHFGDVPSSLFTMFQLVTTEDWIQIATPLIEVSEAWKLFFVVFIVFNAFIMLSLLTAVASDTMISSSNELKEIELQQEQQKNMEFFGFLRNEFATADKDNSGELDKEEFRTLMRKDEVQHQMELHDVRLKLEELIAAWDVFDIDESGELTIDELINGMSYLQEILKTQHIVNLDYNLQRVNQTIETKLEDISQGLEFIDGQREEVLDLVRARTEKMLGKKLEPKLRLAPTQIPEDTEDAEYDE